MDLDKGIKSIKILSLIVLISFFIPSVIVKSSKTDPVEAQASELDEKPDIHLRLRSVTWNLLHLYNCTYFNFDIVYEIWNTGEVELKTSYADSRGIYISIEADWENSSMNLSRSSGAATVITPDLYPVGISTTPTTFQFAIENHILFRLPNGFYRLDFSLEEAFPTGFVAVDTYGANLTVTSTGYDLQYDPFPYSRPQLQDSTSAQLTYTISECVGGPYDWKDGEVNVTVENDSIFFDQILISWVYFDLTQLTIKLNLYWRTLYIWEDYSTTYESDYLRAYRVSGQISNLTRSFYVITFQYTTVSNNQYETRFYSAHRIGWVGVTRQSTSASTSEPVNGFEVVIVLLIGGILYLKRYRW
ncbi:MAG: hypothetical protein ACFFE8_04800 [Candidatus Heimdallarchaeota archaeon]